MIKSFFGVAGATSPSSARNLGCFASLALFIVAGGKLLWVLIFVIGEMIYGRFIQGILGSLFGLGEVLVLLGFGLAIQAVLQALTRKS